LGSSGNCRIDSRRRSWLWPSSPPSGRRHTRRWTTTCPTAVRWVTGRRPLFAHPTPGGGGKRPLPLGDLRLQQLLQGLLAKHLAGLAHVLFRVRDPVPLASGLHRRPSRRAGTAAETPHTPRASTRPRPQTPDRQIPRSSLASLPNHPNSKPQRILPADLIRRHKAWSHPPDPRRARRLDTPRGVPTMSNLVRTQEAAGCGRSARGVLRRAGVMVASACQPDI